MKVAIAIIQLFKNSRFQFNMLIYIISRIMPKRSVVELNFAKRGGAWFVTGLPKCTWAKKGRQLLL